MGRANSKGGRIRDNSTQDLTKQVRETHLRFNFALAAISKCVHRAGLEVDIDHV